MSKANSRRGESLVTLLSGKQWRKYVGLADKHKITYIQTMLGRYEPRRDGFERAGEELKQNWIRNQAAFLDAIVYGLQREYERLTGRTITTSRVE